MRIGKRIFALIAAAIAGFGCASARAVAATETIDGFDALGKLIGNTIVVTAVPGGERIIYLGKDGSLRGRIDGQPNAGKWSFTDGKLCFVKSSGGKAECGAIKVSGTAGTFEIEGHTIGFTIRSGDSVESTKVGSSSPVRPAQSGSNESKVTGSKAAQILVGNTVEGKIADKGLTTVFMAKDGTLVIRQGKDVLKGKWSVDGETMCTDVQGHRDCFEVAVEGARVTWYPPKQGDAPIEFALLTGNARNL